MLATHRCYAGLSAGARPSPQRASDLRARVARGSVLWRAEAPALRSPARHRCQCHLPSLAGALGPPPSREELHPERSGTETSAMCPLFLVHRARCRVKSPTAEVTPLRQARTSALSRGRGSGASGVPSGPGPDRFAPLRPLARRLCTFRPGSHSPPAASSDSPLSQRSRREGGGLLSHRGLWRQGRAVPLSDTRPGVPVGPLRPEM